MVVPLPGCGFEIDRAAMQLDEALDERQAETGPRLRPRIAALELLEDARLVLARHADAGIGDDERDAAAFAIGRQGHGRRPRG